MVFDWAFVVLMLAGAITLVHRLFGGFGWCTLLAIPAVQAVGIVAEKLAARQHVVQIRKWAILRQMTLTHVRAAGPSLFVHPGDFVWWQSCEYYYLTAETSEGTARKLLVAVTGVFLALPVMEIDILHEEDVAEG